MRHVDHGGGIVGAHNDQIARCKGTQTFAGFQNGEGAQKPHGIKFMGHTPQVSEKFLAVHNDVTG